MLVWEAPGVRIEIDEVKSPLLSMAFKYAYTVQGSRVGTPLHGYASCGSAEDLLEWLKKRVYDNERD